MKKKPVVNESNGRVNWKDNKDLSYLTFSILKRLIDQKPDQEYNKTLDECATIMNMIYGEDIFNEGKIFGQEFIPITIVDITPTIMERLKTQIQTGFMDANRFKGWMKQVIIKYGGTP